MKKYLKWLIICVLFFTISVFLHECGHGLANALAIVGNGILLYVPALVSWLITAVCLVITAGTARKRKVKHVFAFSAVSVLAIIIGFAIVFVLDNYIRINWQPFV